MGVWDLMGLHQAITKWKKILEDQELSEDEIHFYKKKLIDAEASYKRELNMWEVRARKYER